MNVRGKRDFFQAVIMVEVICKTNLYKKDLSDE